MIFNLFLPLINFTLYLGYYLNGSPIIEIGFYLTSVSMTFYVLAMSSEVLFNYHKIKELYKELPLESLQRSKFISFLALFVVFAPIVGLLHLTLISYEFMLSAWWTFILIVLGFFMYRLKKMKNEIINEKTRKQYDEEQ